MRSIDLAELINELLRNVASQFAFLLHIFDLKLEYFLLGKLCPSDSADFFHDVQQLGLISSFALESILAAPDIASCDISGSVRGKGDAISQFLSPSWKTLAFCS